MKRGCLQNLDKHSKSKIMASPSVSSKKTGFSLLELSVVLIIISILISSIIGASVALHTARLTSARSLTKTSDIKDIPGITLWLDAVSIESFDDVDIYDGDTIPNWYDIKSSPTAPHIATQTLPTNKPTYLKDGVGKLPAVVFDGVDDFLSVENFSANGFITIFVVGKFANSNFIIEHGDDITTEDGFSFYGVGTPPTTVKRGTGISSNVISNNWFTPNQDAIGVMRYDGTNISYKLNGNAFINAATSSAPDSAINAKLYIGARGGTSLFSSGSFGEIIIFDRALTDDEVNMVLKYLNKKWGVY